MMKFTLALFLLLHTNVILGDYCEPSCECNNEPLIAVQCLNSNLQTIPPSLDPSLQSLVLKHNNIKQIGSASFQFFPDLVTVDLSHNNLLWVQEKTFEEQRILINLDLSHNRLERITNLTFIGLESLEFLDLTQNQLSELGNFSFEHLHKLKELKLNFNKISTIDVNAFSGLGHLANLNLGHNLLSRVETSSLSLLSGLVKLHLDSNLIKTLPQGSFSYLNQLRELFISDNPIEENGMTENSFENMDQLSVLSLQGLQLTMIPEDIFKSVSSLNELLLDRNNIENIQEQSFSDLRVLQVLSLSHNPTLTKIHPGAFQHNRYLTKIDISSNKALSALPKTLLVTLANLSSLNVSHCSLTSLALPPVTEWSSLDLTGNPWVCDCHMASLLGVGGSVTCHQPAGITLSRANLTHCHDTPSRDKQSVTPDSGDSDFVTTVVLVAVILITGLTLVGALGCRYRDSLRHVVTRLSRGKCGHASHGGVTDTQSWSLDTEQFIHISGARLGTTHHIQTPTRPIPVTEL